MAVLRERPYCRFNFLVDIAMDTRARSPDFRRWARSRPRRRHRIPPRQLEREQRRQDHRPRQVHERDAPPRPDRRAQPLSVVRPGAKRRPGGAAHGHDPVAERGPQRRRADLKLLRARVVKFTSGPFNAQSPMSPSKRSSSLRAPRARVTPGSRPAARPLELRRPVGRRVFVRQGFAEVIFPPFALAPAPRGGRHPSADVVAATASHLVLRRGATGALDLYDWWDRPVAVGRRATGRHRAPARGRPAQRRHDLALSQCPAGQPRLLAAAGDDRGY